MTEVSVRLNSGPPVILDGAMGTQLLDRGLDLKLPLWSAEILELSPKIIEEIHKDYINAGAEIITTNTFRTTTRTFRKVFQDNIDKAKKMCEDCDNITYQVADVTNDEWDFPKADVVFIDASHDYPQVAIDIQKCIDYFDKPIIILDDYGNPNNRNIRNSIDDKIRESKIKVHRKIGEDVGFLTKSGWKMVDREGVICTT